MLINLSTFWLNRYKVIETGLSLPGSFLHVVEQEGDWWSKGVVVEGLPEPPPLPPGFESKCDGNRVRLEFNEVTVDEAAATAAAAAAAEAETFCGNPGVGWV